MKLTTNLNLKKPDYTDLVDIGDINDNMDVIDNEIAAHKGEKASQDELGHVKVDEKTIFINEDGEISSARWDDTSGSPGNVMLISGTMEEGFFGEVPSSELITGVALASECGISQGNSQFSSEGWLKFAYQGKIQFVAKKPIRYLISWDTINTAKCVYGDSGDKTVVIDGKTYKVTLMRALEPSNDPKIVPSANSGAVNHHSEWNRLMCQIHEQALSKSWDYPDNIESDIGILEHSLGSGNQGMYSDADLNVGSSGGMGRVSLCQEMATLTDRCLTRGSNDVSNSATISTDVANNNYFGWRPVLRLIDDGEVLENYTEKLTTVSASGGSIDLSLGNVFQHNPSGNITYSITNAVNGQAHSFTLIINMDSTVRTLTFPASVRWQGGEIPDMSTVNKTYILTFMSIDGGTKWLGMFGGEFYVGDGVNIKVKDTSDYSYDPNGQIYIMPIIKEFELTPSDFDWAGRVDESRLSDIISLYCGDAIALPQHSTINVTTLKSKYFIIAKNAPSLGTIVHLTNRNVDVEYLSGNHFSDNIFRLSEDLEDGDIIDLSIIFD